MLWHIVYLLNLGCIVRVARYAHSLTKASVTNIASIHTDEFRIPAYDIHCLMSLFALLFALCTFVTLCIDYQRKMRCIRHNILSTLSALQSTLLKFESVGAGSNLLHRTRDAVATV